MSAYDLIIRNGALVTEDGERQANIGVAGGEIVTVEPELTGGAMEELDATGLYIFPGVMDAHLHFNEPGRVEWEGIATGSRAVAAGGGTCYFDMPLNAHPPTVDADAFDAKLAAARASSLVDFGLWGGIVPGNLDKLDELAERGVVGYKAFMANSGIEDFTASDDLALYEGMEGAARLGRIVAVHAENDALVTGLGQRARAEGRTGVRDFLASRPVIAELDAIQRAIIFAEETGCALHIVHVSTGRGVALVVAARARGVNVTCETCPHYLVITEADVEELGAVAKCAPPLRPESDRSELWERVIAGEVAFVASEHSPAPASMKTGDDFFAIWGGISGCQTLLRSLLTAGWEERGLPLAQIAALTSSNVARRFNIAKKGRLAPGYDADLALIDLGASDVLQQSDLLYRHPHSPFVGRRLRGRIARTILRGHTVYAEGRVVAEPMGALVRPDR
jgi:allantoinase